ncbi:MAG: pyridoxamine kinase [Victivallales bacterium]|nr:pyridoxamine kinase [Victivallales bacterium]
MSNPIPKVAAVHDLSGFGRSSLAVVLPVLSSMGIQVSSLPTAVLSTHSEYPDFRMVNLTEYLEDFIQHWEKLNIKFNAIYSGFLGSDKQIEIVKKLIKTFYTDDLLVVIDPVLGDNGELYEPFKKSGMVANMKNLIKDADIITPNITEAALLLDKRYTEGIYEKEVVDWAKQLAEKGPDKVIITSVPEKNKKFTSVIAYNTQDKRSWKVTCDYLPAKYPGTGDAFTSVIVGALLQNDSLPVAVERAVQFISYSVRAAFGHDYDPLEGVLFEKALSTLSYPVMSSTYQLLDY